MTRDPWALSRAHRATGAEGLSEVRLGPQVATRRARAFFAAIGLAALLVGAVLLFGVVGALFFVFYALHDMWRWPWIVALPVTVAIPGFVVLQLRLLRTGCFPLLLGWRRWWSTQPRLMASSIGYGTGAAGLLCVVGLVIAGAVSVIEWGR